MNETTRILCLVLATLPVPHLFAQAAPPATPQTGEVVELNPFQVNSSEDKGYEAENTLSGSRLNTRLRDTPAPVSVFTKQFLEDLNYHSIDQLTNYSVGSQIYTQDSNSAPNANDFLGGAHLTKTVTARGINTIQAIDYFASITPGDGYRFDRYDESRGPNGILFGIGSAGGIYNQSSIIASLSQNSGKIGYEYGEYNQNRVELHLNEVLVRKKLAIAIATVDQDSDGWRKPTVNDKLRRYGTVTIRPIDRLTIRINGERGNEHTSALAPFGAFDGGLAWIQDGRLTVAPTNKNPTAAQIAQGVATLNGTANATTKRYVYIQNSNTLFDSAGTYVTGSYNNPGVRGPDGTSFGASGTVITPALAINNPSFLPYDINSGGPGMYRATDFWNSTVSVDYHAASHLDFNVSRNYQQIHLVNPLIKNSTPMISGDANTTQGFNGPPNPYAGQLYIDSPWFKDLHNAKYRESRASVSYDLEPKWKWLGSHRIAAAVSSSFQSDFYDTQNFGFLGAPFNANPLNASNLLTQRVYLDGNNPYSFVSADWRRLPKTLTIGGTPYNLGWLDGTSGPSDSYAEQHLTSDLVVVQSAFLNKRLIGTFGYRKDKGAITSYATGTDPVLLTTTIDRNPADATKVYVTGITRTMGGVAHLTDWVSLVANHSSNIGIPTFTDHVFPYGNIASPSQGTGEDYGVRFDLFSGRLSMSFDFFRTSQNGATKSGGIAARYSTRDQRISDAFKSVLVGPGLPFSATDWIPINQSLNPPVGAELFDQKSKGRELSITMNLTPNWRLTAGYSYTDTKWSDIGINDAVPWYGLTMSGGLVKQGVSSANGTVDPTAFTANGTVARWIALSNLSPAANLSTLQTTGQNPNITVANEIFNLINDINTDKVQNEQRWGLRPNKANLFTAYDITTGRLSGLTGGIGYRWRQAQIIGTDFNGHEIQGRITSVFDLMLRYRQKIGVWRLKGIMTYQLNVDNLLNNNGILPQRFSSVSTSPTTIFNIPSGGGVAYARFDLLDPRVIRFSTTYSF